MKAIILSFTFIFLFLISATSQNFMIEFSGAVCKTTLRGDDFSRENIDPRFSIRSYESKSNIYYGGGIGISAMLSKHSSINIQLNYDRKGAKCEFEYYWDTFMGREMGYDKYEKHYDYLTVPVLYGFEVGKTIKIKLLLGPYWAFLLQGSSTSNFLNSDITAETKQFDFGITTGAFVYLPCNEISEQLYLKFGVINNLGLVNISALGLPDNGTIKTNSLNFTIGLAYKFKNKLKEKLPTKG